MTFHYKLFSLLISPQKRSYFCTATEGPARIFPTTFCHCVIRTHATVELHQTGTLKRTPYRLSYNTATLLQTHFGFVYLGAALLGLDDQLLAVGLGLLDSVGIDFEHVGVAGKAKQWRGRRLQTRYKGKN